MFDPILPFFALAIVTIVFGGVGCLFYESFQAWKSKKAESKKLDH